MSWLPGSIRAALALLWTGALLPPQLLAVRWSPRAARFIPQLYHKGAARILGLSLEVEGEPVGAAPVLFVVNHVSWVDIVVLGSVLQAGFVAKSEVKGWPGVGLLARLQGTVFIERRPHKIRGQADQVTRALKGGRRLILFPEGTSNDGNRVLPFRSGFFSVAERWDGPEALPVQPVSLSYVRNKGLPLLRARRPDVAWYGDMELAPHLWAMLCRGGGLTVRLEFHPAVRAGEFSTRKALAEHCRNVVRNGVSGAVSGRSGALAKLDIDLSSAHVSKA